MERIIKISDIAKINARTINKTDNFAEIMYLDTGSVTKNVISSIQRINTNKDKVPSRAKRKVKDKTIIYSTVRPNQEHYAFLEKPEANLIVSTGFATLDIIDNKIDEKFIFYLLTQKHITDYLQMIGENSVSAYPAINPNELGKLKFEIPKELQIQQKIAQVLSALDRKIALNQQINTELEKMAKTLYDYWFVQFDFPDENGNPYKSSGGEMVYNPELKREVPKGWEVKKLGEIANITMGQSPSGDSYNEERNGTIFFQGCTDFNWRYPTIRQYTTQPSRMAKKGDILLSVRAPVGTMNLTNFDCCIGRGLAALNSKNNANSFLFYVMKSFEKDFALRNSVGTTFGSITKDDLFSLKLIFPMENVLQKYEEIISKYNEMISKRSIETQKLTQLRDFLLPMLMNGQVEVE